MEQTISKEQFEKEMGTKVWDTDDIREQFDVIGFMAPYVVMKRKVDGVKGSMEFTHSPRFYFNWRADNS